MPGTSEVFRAAIVIIVIVGSVVRVAAVGVVVLGVSNRARQSEWALS